MTRAERKWDHIKYALKTGQMKKTGLEDVTFIHQSIPETSVDCITLETKIGELDLSSPIFINAMTGGGGEKTQEINRQLAIVARETGLGMAVGSQMAAIKNRAERSTFEVVRKENPCGVIFANLGSEADVSQAVEAVKMLNADGLQIHLNVVQELTMPEGDRDFIGMLSRIERIVSQVDRPVIVKETGFGMGYETIEALLSVGVYAVDVSGYGGTNFAAIENERGENRLPFFEDWGISTAVSVIEARSVNANLPIIASGGIQNSYEIAKVIGLGANGVALAGHLLKILLKHGSDELVAEIERIKAELRMIMTALGTRTIAELQKAPMMISGETWHHLEQRGIDTKEYSLRKK